MKGEKSNKKVSELTEGEDRRKDGIIIGIEVHREAFSCCIINGTEILKEGELSEQPFGIKKLIMFSLGKNFLMPTLF
ncbi:MAG: hypothetical protein ACTSRP_05615 [Candidatus Helarchaeota archaeon]